MQCNLRLLSGQARGRVAAYWCIDPRIADSKTTFRKGYDHHGNRNQFGRAYLDGMELDEFVIAFFKDAAREAVALSMDRRHNHNTCDCGWEGRVEANEQDLTSG